MTAADYVAACCAAPAQDAPRLAYADWLAARGEPAGAYIRWAVQTRPDDADGVAAVQAGADPEIGAGYVDTATRLLTATFDPAHRTQHLLDWQFRRGFLAQVRIGPDAWRRYGDHLTWSRTAECRGCGGTGRAGGVTVLRAGPGDLVRRWDPAAPPCPACRGDGLRPCPETAGPGLVVYLTGLPLVVACDAADWNTADAEATIRRDGPRAVMRRDEWPYDDPHRPDSVLGRLLRATYPGVARFEIQDASRVLPPFYNPLLGEPHRE